jgi:aldehyde:ferredoxin oxidoreductase
MDKILRINVGADGGPQVTEDSLGDYAGLAGRALTSAIVAKEVPPTCHPLSGDNKLVIAPGMLSGTTAAMSGRISVGCKSPLTGGIKESNAGGQGSQVLARLGYAAIVLEGKPKDGTLYKVHIDKDGVNVAADNSLCMLGNYDLVDKMKDEFGGKVATISIGPAGEMKMAAASVAFSDMEQRPTRHAGRGGVGAVMGAKGIKVIVLDDAGMKMRAPKDPDAFKEANQKFVAGLRKHPVTGEGLPAYGTNVLTNVINEAGAYPTKNFMWGRFDTCSKISGETQAETEEERGGKGAATHGCHRGCIIRCSGTYLNKDGQFLTKQPEYETVWAHGGNCGIDDLDAIAMLDRLDFGVERVPVVKGQAMPAYDPRGVQGIGVTYATSTQGADHTAGYAVATNILGVGGSVDPLSAEGQVELSRNLQIATAAIDSTGMCLFIAFAIMDQEDTFQALIDLINTFYGLSLTGDDVVALGKKVLSFERDFNARAGFTKQDDRLPDYFKTEELPPHNITFKVTDEDLDQVFNF